MRSEASRWREFSEFVTDHKFGTEDWDVFFSVVDTEGVTHEFWGNRTGARPGTDYFFLTSRIHRIDFFDEAGINVRTFFG